MSAVDAIAGHSNWTVGAYEIVAEWKTFDAGETRIRIAGAKWVTDDAVSGRSKRACAACEIAFLFTWETCDALETRIRLTRIFNFLAIDSISGHSLRTSAAEKRASPGNTLDARITRLRIAGVYENVAKRTRKTRAT